MAKKTKQQEELLREYRKVMQRVNKRLERLEKLAEKPEYENVLKYAYQVAARDVKELGLGDIEKVRYRIPYNPRTGTYNTNKLKAALRRAEAFEKLATSSKSGIDRTYKQDATNFNKAFGTNFTWAELKNFTEKVNWDSLKKNYESKTIQRMIRKLIKNEIKASDIQKAAESNKKINGLDAVESDWMKKMAADGLNPDLLFTGTGKGFEPIEDAYNPFID